MRVTSLQLEIKSESKQERVRRVLELLEEVPASDLILLPEIWPTGYFSFSRYQEEAEELHGALVAAFQEKARQLRTHIFMGSFVEKSGKHSELYNTSLLLNPEGVILAEYRKIHLFGFQSDERKLLTAGKEIAVADCPWGKTGLATCYDLRFPELFRKMVDAEASYFLITSAWPLQRQDAWRLFNRSRAHENLAFLFSCNCAGEENGRPYAGHSMFVNPLGQVMAEAGEEEEILTAEFDPHLVKATRQEFSALRDRVFVDSPKIKI